MSSFESIDLGLLSWQDALQAQLAYAQRAQQGERFLLFVEHPPVLTLGRNANPNNLKLSEAELAARGIAVHRCERGGDVTAHLPGQVVMYPVMRLTNPFGVRAYITALEHTILAVLHQHGIAARVRPGLPGVWVDAAKIAFIGIRIKNRVTQHGLALNVNNELTLFDLIVPCGLPNIAVTSMRQLLHQELSLSTVKDKLQACFVQTLAEASTPVLK